MRILVVMVLALFSFALCIEAQEVEQSSGKVQLNMKKSSGKVQLNMKKPEDQSQPGVTNTNMSTVPSTTGSINWVSPAFDQVQTSEGTYRVQANIKSPEQIRVINFFVNGVYYKNYMPSGSSRNEMFIEETLNLKLGGNGVKIEAITVSNKKIECAVNISYDISSAKYHALIIAVEEYDDPYINDLDEPINDADRFYSVITSKYTFDQENILYLKNPTKADIIGTLHKMRGILKPEDNLLIYYAGHGHWDEEMKTGYWLPSDANRDNPVNWLPNTDLTNYLNVLKTKHTLLIADACFSGGFFKTLSAFTSSAAIE